MAKQKVYYQSYDRLLSEMVLLTGHTDRRGNIDDAAALYLIWSPLFALAKEADASSIWTEEAYEKFSAEDWHTRNDQQRHIESVLHWPDLDQQYRLSDDFEQLGTHWKELLREQSEKWTRRLIVWIDQYRQELFPAANAFIEKYENKDCCNQRKSHYQEYRAMLLQLQRKLESLAEFFQMLGRTS